MSDCPPGLVLAMSDYARSNTYPPCVHGPFVRRASHFACSGCGDIELAPVTVTLEVAGERWADTMCCGCDGWFDPPDAVLVEQHGNRYGPGRNRVYHQECHPSETDLAGWAAMVAAEEAEMLARFEGIFRLGFPSPKGRVAAGFEFEVTPGLKSLPHVTHST